MHDKAIKILFLLQCYEAVNTTSADNIINETDVRL